MISRIRPPEQPAHQPDSGTDQSSARIIGLRCEFLQSIDIFRDLSEEDLGQIAGILPKTNVARGHVVYHQDDRAEEVFLLESGRVRLSRLSPTGKRLEIALLSPGTFFGEMPLLGVHMRNVEAEAVEDCTLCAIRTADVERVILSQPIVALRMLEILGKRLADAEVRLEDLAYRSVPARLCAVLLRLATTDNGDVVGLTHQDLGDMVGAYRETVSKILDEFRDLGHLELGRRRIRILRRSALVALLEDSGP